MGFLVLTIIFTLVPNGLFTTIEISPRKVFLTVNEAHNLTVNATDVSETSSIEFRPQYQDIVSVKPPHWQLEEGNKTYTFVVNGLSPGHCEVTAVSQNGTLDLRNIYLVANVCKSKTVEILSKVAGWCFIISWGVSFYPQIFMNYQRKSVIGLHFDYFALETVGYLLFGAFIHGLYFVPEVQRLYFEKYPRGLIPVKTNDVVSNLHGLFGLIVTIIQCFIYESGGQTISKTARTILGVTAVFVVINLILLKIHVFSILVFLYYCSYIKLLLTVLKYIPQLYMNYKRKSTDGWSIGVVFLDLNGGTLCILQMILDSYNYDDWVSIFGNPTKFTLGVITIAFHCVFITQHYVLYRKSNYILIK